MKQVRKIYDNTFNTQFVAQLSVTEFENGDFIFYPNPVSDVVTVSLKNLQVLLQLRLLIYHTFQKACIYWK